MRCTDSVRLSAESLVLKGGGGALPMTNDIASFNPFFKCVTDVLCVCVRARLCVCVCVCVCVSSLPAEC